jgi:uncharacterized protein
MLLFLDFDGVLHPALDGREPNFCRLPLLESVLRDAPHVRIVISSTWREGFTLDELRGLFSPDIAARVVGATPSLPESSRHAEIMRYLEQHATHTTAWIAIDDAIFEFPRGCPYLVACSGRTGLTPDVAQELARRLAEADEALGLSGIALAEPDLPVGPLISGALVRELRRGFRLDRHGAHGVAHWARVRVNGLALAAQTGANPRLVELFAFVHDCERHSEGDDPLHGARAARRIRALRPWLPGLMQDELALLESACRGHTGGHDQADITVLTCWDADRLDLGRVGIVPDPRHLCSAAARQPDVIAAAHGRALAWLDLRDRRR